MELTPDQLFFFTHAGFSYDPKTETADQGRARCAIALAEAETLYLQAHKVDQVSIHWEHDEIGAADEGEFEVCEVAYIVHLDEAGHAHTLASLGAIWDADDNYRRVIRAELASECADKLRAIIEQSKGE